MCPDLNRGPSKEGSAMKPSLRTCPGCSLPCEKLFPQQLTTPGLGRWSVSPWTSCPQCSLHLGLLMQSPGQICCAVEPAPCSGLYANQGRAWTTPSGSQGLGPLWTHHAALPALLAMLLCGMAGGHGHLPLPSHDGIFRLFRTTASASWVALPQIFFSPDLLCIPHCSCPACWANCFFYSLQRHHLQGAVGPATCRLQSGPRLSGLHSPVGGTQHVRAEWDCVGKLVATTGTSMPSWWCTSACLATARDTTLHHNPHCCWVSRGGMELLAMVPSFPTLLCPAMPLACRGPQFFSFKMTK